MGNDKKSDHRKPWFFIVFTVIFSMIETYVLLVVSKSVGLVIILMSISIVFFVVIYRNAKEMGTKIT